MRVQLQEATDKNALLEGSAGEPKKRDEDMILRQLRAQLAAQLKREAKLKMQLKTASMQRDDALRKGKSALTKEKAKTTRQAKELSFLRSRKTTLEQLVAEYERHGDHDSLIQRVKALSEKNEEKARECAEREAERDALAIEIDKERRARSDNDDWMRQFARRALHRGKHWRRCLYAYWEWASEMVYFTEEKLREARAEVREFEGVLKIESRKSRERQIVMERYVKQSQEETRAARVSLEGVKRRLRATIKDRRALAEELQRQRTTGARRKALLVAWWVAWMMLGARRKAERAQQAARAKSRELTIKALRTRLAVYRSESEERLCAERLAMQKEISDLSSALDQSRRDAEAISTQKDQGERAAEDTVSELRETEAELARRLAAAELSSATSEQRLETALREFKMRAAEQDACEDQLGWCLERLRVSEVRRLELEGLFGTVAQPSQMVADEVERIRGEHRARRMGKRRAEAESLLSMAVGGGSQILGYSPNASYDRRSAGEGAGVRAGGNYDERIFGIPSVDADGVGVMMDEDSIWSNVSSSSSDSASTLNRALMRRRLKMPRPKTSPGLRDDRRNRLSPLEKKTGGRVGGGGGDRGSPTTRKHARAKSAGGNSQPSRDLGAPRRRPHTAAVRQRQKGGGRGHWVSPFVRKRRELVEKSIMGGHSMMLKKGIVRRRATQSASRSRRRREIESRRRASGRVGSGGSAVMMESLTSTLDRAEMKKSLLQWGDDDSILLKPYPIESFESGVMLPGAVLDYTTAGEAGAAGAHPVDAGLAAEVGGVGTKQDEKVDH